METFNKITLKIPSMNTRIFSGHTLYAVTLLAALSGCATTSLPPLAIPDALQAPAGQKLVLDARATGVQIYVCSAAKADPAQTQWVFKAPEATLFDAAGNSVATHFAGPSWESPDGSKVVGAVQAKQDDPAGKAIPQLLLSAKSVSGSGVFGAVTYIQRLATEAGNAPAGGCTAAELGKEARVPYTARYRFYVSA